MQKRALNFKNSMVFVNKMNVPRTICNHLFGKEHSLTHRISVGSVIMAIGVGIAKCGLLLEPFFFHFAGDLIGFLVHAIGATPIIERVIQWTENNGTI